LILSTTVNAQYRESGERLLESEDVVNRIVSERSRSATLAAIADELDANGIPTA
jgi:hypothetical protein